MAWKASDKGGDPVRIDLGDQDDHIGVLGGIRCPWATIPSTFAERAFGQIDRLDDVGTDLAPGWMRPNRHARHFSAWRKI
jgi:hypothetical protein